MANRSDEDLGKKRRPKKKKPEKQEASPSQTTTRLRAPRTKPASRIRLKALRPSTNTAMPAAPTPTAPNIPAQRPQNPKNTSASPSKRPNAPSARKRAPTQPSTAEPNPIKGDEHKATNMDRSDEALLKTPATPFNLGYSQIPEESSDVETNEKTVVGFAVEHGSKNLGEGVHREPVPQQLESPLWKGDPFNDEKTILGTATKPKVRTITTPPTSSAPTRTPVPPPLPHRTTPPKLRKSVSASSPPPMPATAPLIAPTSDDDILRHPKRPSTSQNSSQGRNQESRRGSRPIPLSDVAPSKAESLKQAKGSFSSTKSEKNSAANIRGGRIHRDSLVNLDPIMPPSSPSSSRARLDPLVPPESSARLIPYDAKGRASPIYTVRNQRRSKRSDHGWATGMLLGVLPGGHAFANGHIVTGVKESAVAVMVLLPALIVLLTWSSQTARMAKLSISETWLVAHSTVCVGALLAYEALRVVTSPHRNAITFIAPRWVAVFFVPCLFLLQLTHKLTESVPRIIEPLWYSSLILGGISCMASIWCIFYDVRALGPKNIRFWAATSVGLILFTVLLIVSGVIPFGIMF